MRKDVLRSRGKNLGAALLASIIALTGCAAEIKQEANAMKNLPQPVKDGEISLEKAIEARRSVRSFSGAPLSESELSQLLWAAQGITEKNRNLRAAPSAGATYPLNTYVFSANGVFKYDPVQHALANVHDEDMRERLSEAALGQGFVRSAPVSVVFTAVPERTTRRYGSRGMMYIHMEAGHAAQNIHLQAVALGLGSVPVGAFNDKQVSALIGLKGSETPLYIIPVGRASQ